MPNIEGEVHRLKDRPDNFDEEHFNKCYKNFTPLIRSLCRNIDVRRFGIDLHLLKDYFYDKLYFVYVKYHDLIEDNPEKFKATIISSLTTYKNRILRDAYNSKAEFQGLFYSLENIYENKDGDIALADEEQSDSRVDWLMQYMESHLSGDAFLLFRTQLNPPPFFTQTKVTTEQLLDYFELPKSRCYIKHISTLRKEINTTLESLSTTEPDSN